MLCNCIALLCGQRFRPFHLIVSVFPEVYLGHDGLRGGLGWAVGGAGPQGLSPLSAVYLSPQVADVGQAEIGFGGDSQCGMSSQPSAEPLSGLPWPKLEGQRASSLTFLLKPGSETDS